METKLVKIEAKNFGLEKKQVSDVDLAFAEKVKERKLITKIYSQIIKKDINKEVALESRELRLKVVKLKSGIAKIHKTQKEFALAFGKYCDAWKRKETEPLQQIIDNLTEIEKFEEIQEKKRLDKLQHERAEKLDIYVEDAHERNLSGMDADVWNAYFSTKKKEYEDRIDAEKKAEKKRIAKEKAEAKERKRIAKENEKLKKEAKERERLEKIESDKREKAEQKRRKKEESERKIREEKERIEREKREKLEDELNAKKEAEKKAENDRLAKIEKNAKKGDADKVRDLVADLVALKTKYSFKSAKYKRIYSGTCELIDKVTNYIEK